MKRIAPVLLSAAVGRQGSNPYLRQRGCNSEEQTVKDNRRLHILLLLLAATIVLGFYYDRSAAPLRTGSTGILPAFQGHVSRGASPIAEIHQRPATPDNAGTTVPHRNLFRYTGVPPAPKYVPPPPPPPPPEIKPESRFLGTLDQGHLQALFAFKGDVLPLKEGETLEGKYVIKRVETDSVVLVDRTSGNEATLTMVKTSPTLSPPQSSPENLEQRAASFAFDPMAIPVEQGLQFSVRVTLGAADPFESCMFDLTFDDSLIDVIRLDQGRSIRSPFGSEVRRGRISVKFRAGRHFDGTVCDIIFAARVAGSTKLDIENAHVADDLGIELTLFSTPASVQIEKREPSLSTDAE